MKGGASKNDTDSIVERGNEQSNSDSETSFERIENIDEEEGKQHQPS
jgi:hypothetical protein